MPRLTKSLLDALAVPGRESMVWDSALPGFGVRVRPGSGVKRFYVQYRTPSGQQRKRALGRYGVLTVEEARAQARQWLAAVQRGDDPAATPAVPHHTMADLAARYLREHAARQNAPESQRKARSMLRDHLLPQLGHLDVQAVSRADILALQAQVADYPVRANRVLALVSALFTWAERWEWRAPRTHPVWRIPRFPERPRERYLTPAEAQRLWRVLDEVETARTEHPSVVGGIRLLLLTGARSGEVKGLRWAQIDWQTGQVRLSTSKTGAKTLYLAPETLEVVRALPHAPGNPYVLPGTLPGKPWHDLRRPWYRVRRLAGLDDVRLHDLRHTYASVAVAAGLSLSKVGKLLGHSRSQTTQRYAHLADTVAQEAARQVGEHMRQVVHAGEAQAEAPIEAPTGEAQA
jgi:integrase